MMLPNDEVVYLNNCQLIIESISSKVKGSYYLGWKKGKKITQSNKFQITNDQALAYRQLLTLSLKIYYQSNVAIPRHTHLILYSSNGQQIGRESLMINEWGNQYTPQTIKINDATIKIKVKRKSIMKLQKFHKMRSEVEQSSEDQRSRYLRRGSIKPNMQKEEMMRLKKQVEDMTYLVQKLKEERNNGLIKIQKLQEQISQVNDKMIKDITKLKDYFTHKIQMRQSVYKEEIQQLIVAFNKNYDMNHSILSSLIMEKFQYQQEILQLKSTNLQYINKMEQHYDSLAQTMEENETKISNQLALCLQKIKQKQSQIISLNDMLDELQGKYSNLQNIHQSLQNKYNHFQDETKKTIQNMKAIIQQSNARHQEDKQLINKINNQNQQKVKQIEHFNIVLKETFQQKAQISSQKFELQAIKDTLNQKIDMLELTIEQNMRSLKASSEQIERMAEEYQIRSEQYQKQINQSNIANHQELTKATNQYHKLNLQYEQTLFENNELKQTVDLYQQKQKHKEIQFEHFKAELQAERKKSQSQQNEIAANIQIFKNNLDEVTKRLSESLQMNNIYELQNSKLKNQVIDITQSLTKELEMTKNHYQTMFESEKKILEDDIEVLKVQREEQNLQYEQYKQQYEIEIKNMIIHQQQQTDELQLMYQQQLQTKNREYIELMLKFDNLMKLYEQSKQKIPLNINIPKIQEQHQQTKRLKKSINKPFGMPKITQDDEDEQQQEQIVEISSQQSEQQPIHQKRRNRNFKKKQNLNESSSQKDSQQQSIVLNIKKMKSSKSPKSINSNSNYKQKIEQFNSIDEANNQIPMQRSAKNLKPLFKYTQSEDQNTKLKNSRIKHKSLKQVIQTKDLQIRARLQLNIEQLQKIIAEKQKNIAEQEDKIFNLETKLTLAEGKQKKNTEKLERQAKIYSVKLKAQQQQIVELNKQIDILTAKIQQTNLQLANKAKQNVKQKRKFLERKKTIQMEMIEEQISKVEQQVQKKQIEQQNALQLAKSRRQSQKSIKSANKVSRKLSQNSNISRVNLDEKKLKLRIQELMNQLSDKQKIIQQLQKKVKIKSKELEKSRFQNQNHGKNNMYESNQIEYQGQKQMNQGRDKNTQLTINQQKHHYLEIQAKNKSGNMQMSFGQFNMKSSIAQLQEKFSTQKQKYFQLKLKYQQKNRQYQQLQTEMRKLKSSYNQIQQKARKNVTIPKSVQQLQNQIQQCNKKILDISRNLNQVKLQRDSNEDELRILKKKLTENQKNSQQWQSKALQSQRQIDDCKRKQFKNKRQLQQKQQQQKRLKDQIKKFHQELNEMRKYQNQYVMERKKVLDEVVRLQDIISQKQNEIVKLNKEAERLRAKLQQDRSGKNNKQKQYRIQIEKNQVQKSQLQKKSKEFQQVIRILKDKLQTSQRQNKKINEQRKQTYGQKLKKYIQQVISVKKIVEELQDQNVRYKIQNSQFFEHNQILKMSYQKLQIKFEELSQYQRNLTQQLQKSNIKISQLEAKMKQKQIEQQKLNVMVGTLRKQLQNQRMASRKKTEKLQNYEQINERYLYEIKNLKIKLNDVSIDSSDKLKLAEEINESQRTIDSLSQELNKISSEYKDHSSKYVYTREDIQNALKQLKDYEQKLKEEQINKMAQQLDTYHSQNRQNMQNELIQLYSQNQKLRINLQKITQQALQLQMQLSEVQALRQKSKRLDKQKTLLQRRLSEAEDQLKSSKEEIRRLQVKFNNSIRNQEEKNTQNLLLSQKYTQINKRYQDLNQSTNYFKAQHKKVLDKYKIANEDKQKTIQTLNSQFRTLNSKCLSLQLQINRLKELQRINLDQYNKKIMQLQRNLEQTVQYHGKTQKQTENKNKNMIRDLKNKISRHEEEISQRNHTIQDLNEGMLLLQSQIEQITQQLTNNRAQLADQNEFYTLEINKLRNQMSEMQYNHSAHIARLEQQICLMSKQLTFYKVSRQNGGNSKLRESKHSDNGDEKLKRFQEKIRIKDKRIQELKQTITAFQQKLKSLNITGNKGQEMNQLKTKMATIQKQTSELLQKKSNECNKWIQECKKLNQQLFAARSQQEQLKLLIEQRQLECQSLKAENKTISKLYNDLQHQIEKRKQFLSNQHHLQQLKEHIKLQHQQQIQFKNLKIEQHEKNINILQQCIKKMQQQNRTLKQENQKHIIDIQRLLSVKQEQIPLTIQNKMKYEALQEQYNAIKTQNRKLQNDINQYLRLNDHLKSQVNNKSTTINQLIKQIQVNDNKLIQNQQIINKYIGLNEKSRNIMALQLEQALNLCIQQKQSLNDKEKFIQTVIEDKQEMIFLYQRKNFDYQQLKKENYSMLLKMQELQLNSNQVEYLLERLEQCERQRQSFLRRQEAIKEQLDLFNENQRTNSSIKRNIYNILTNKY